MPSHNIATDEAIAAAQGRPHAGRLVLEGGPRRRLVRWLLALADKAQYSKVRWYRGLMSFYTVLAWSAIFVMHHRARRWQLQLQR